jgi:hypothetical protein
MGEKAFSFGSGVPVGLWCAWKLSSFSFLFRLPGTTDRLPPSNMPLQEIHQRRNLDLLLSSSTSNDFMILAFVGSGILMSKNAISTENDLQDEARELPVHLVNHWKYYES